MFNLGGADLANCKETLIVAGWDVIRILTQRGKSWSSQTGVVGAERLRHDERS
jgi:hypothetical protein